MKKDRGRRSLWIAVVAGVLVLSLGFILLPSRPGILVTVKNTGTKPLRSVVLLITGKPCPLGDIAPHDSAQATVFPTGESDLKIELTETNGGERRLNVDCYMERGYRGVIQTAVKDGRIDETAQRIDVRLP